MNKIYRVRLQDALLSLEQYIYMLRISTPYLAKRTREKLRDPRTTNFSWNHHNNMTDYK